MQKQLEKFGFRIKAVEKGAEVLESLQQDAFEVVLMDVQMPRMNGVAATRAIREGKAGRRKICVPIVAIVAMTAYAMKRDKEHFLAAGMDAYVSKTVDMENLLEKLSKFG